MTHSTSALPLTALAILAACGSTQPVLYPSPVSYLSASLGRSRSFEGTEEPESLFPSDIAVLNDSAIRRILGHELTLPDSGKMAVLYLPGRWSYGWWQEAPSRMNEFVADQVIQQLQASSRVRMAVVLPRLLIPRAPSVPLLREIAARFQSDLLFVFQPRCETYLRTRFLASDRVEATCTVEAVLLDTRTGIIPFSDVVTHDYEATKTGSDANFRETIARAELAAITDALAETVGNVVRFVETTPMSAP